MHWLAVRLVVQPATQPASCSATCAPERSVAVAAFVLPFSGYRYHYHYAIARSRSFQSPTEADMSKTTCHSANTTACTASMQTQPLELLYWFSLRVCERDPRCMMQQVSTSVECADGSPRTPRVSMSTQRESVRTDNWLAKAKMPLANTQGISASQSFSQSNLKSPCAPNQMRSTQPG